MKKLAEKVKLSQIDWVKVINGLDGKTEFTKFDVQKALKKIGMDLSMNRLFRETLKQFIEALGNTVSFKEDFSGDELYIITSTKDAIKAVSEKPKLTKEAKKTENGDSLSDTEKVRELYNSKNKKDFSFSIYILAVFVKHSTKQLLSNEIREEFLGLGLKKGVFTQMNINLIHEIYKRLDFDTLVKKKINNPWYWEFQGENDLLDEYIRLCKVWHELSGEEFRNLDDYIMGKKAETKTTTTIDFVQVDGSVTEDVEGVTTSASTITPTPSKSYEEFSEPKRRKWLFTEEEDLENIWRKWLIISAVKHLGNRSNLKSILSWIETDRHYHIDEEAARKYCCELMIDSEYNFNYHHQTNIVTINSLAWKKLSKKYDPHQFSERFLIKLPISIEETSLAYMDKFKYILDEKTTSGKYLYIIEADRSFSCEVALKDLMRLLRNVSGVLYTDSSKSFILNRILNIIQKEDQELRSKNSLLFSMEDKIGKS